MAIRREQSGRGGTLQFNNTLQGDYQSFEQGVSYDYMALASYQKVRCFGS